MTAPDTSSSPIAVVIIDSDDVNREGVASLLASDGRFVVLRSVRSASEAQLERHWPDLICCDPQVSGRLDDSMIPGLAAAVPEAYICIFSASFNSAFVLNAGRDNLGMYLLKGGVAARYLLATLDLIAHTGVVIIDPSIAAQFRDRRHGRLVLQQAGPEAAKLTEREIEVLRLYGGDQRVEEIAQRLHIDHRTVSTHLRNARDRLGARTNAELVRLATEQGLLDP